MLKRLFYTSFLFLIFVFLYYVQNYTHRVDLVNASYIAGQKDISFDTGVGQEFDNSVDFIVKDSDNKTLIGGGFTTYYGTLVTRFVRLNSDDTIDSTFNIGTGFNSVVKSITIQGDGKVIVGGQFTTYNGVGRNRIVRLNSDGSLDTSFVIGTGFSTVVNTHILQGDGKVIAGGVFTSYNGVSRNRIARLNSDGSLDTTFVVGTGFDNEVKAISLQGDGKVIVGGLFTSYNGTSINRIVRLNSDGSLDTSFDVGTGLNERIEALTLQGDGKVILGGEFTTYNGVGSNRIVRLNSDGSLDASFDVGTGFNITVRTHSLQGDGKVIVGGAFSTYNSVSSNRIVRLNSDGSLDTTFVVGTGFSSTVNHFLIQADGKLVLGGLFTNYNGISRTRIARLNSDGSLDITFDMGSGLTNSVNAIAVQADGKVLVGGDFIEYDGFSRPRIVRLNSDGSLDTTFVVGTGFPSSVNSIAIQDDGKVIVAGAFTSYGGVSRPRILRLNSDGSLDTTFVVGTGFNTTVREVVIQSDGKIIAVGDFITYGGTSTNRIVRLNADGSLDSSFDIGTGFNNSVRTLSLVEGGKVIIGGTFTAFNGTSLNRVARLNSDGSLDTTLDSGTGFNSTVLDIALQSDGKLIFGGLFATYNGVSCSRIVRINNDGSLDTTFVVGSGFNTTVNTLSLQGDGRVIVGGAFATYQGVSRSFIARLNNDGSLDSTFNIGTGFNAEVRSAYLQSDGKVILGGIFVNYDGSPTPYLIRLLNPPLHTVTYDGNEGCCVPSVADIESGSDAPAPACHRPLYSVTSFTRTVGSGGTLNTSTGEVTNVSGDQTIRADWNSDTPASSNCNPLPGDSTHTITGNCSFPYAIDGVDIGTGSTNTGVLNLDSGVLTINNSQTIVAGAINLTGGSIFMIDGSEIKMNTPIFIVDADGDGWASAWTFYTASAAGRVRRNTLQSLSILDCNDSVNEAANLCCGS